MTLTDQQKKTRLSALNLLSRREHTEIELRRKLQTKGFPLDDIQLILNQLTQENLLSHARFLENYIHHRNTKGYGPLRIRAELLERGLKEDFIEHHLNMTDNVWFAAARAAWQKRFKGQKPKDFKTRAQQMRFLIYRGFTQEHIERIYANNDE